MIVKMKNIYPVQISPDEAVGYYAGLDNDNRGAFTVINTTNKLKKNLRLKTAPLIKYKDCQESLNVAYKQYVQNHDVSHLKNYRVDETFNFRNIIDTALKYAPNETAYKLAKFKNFDHIKQVHMFTELFEFVKRDADDKQQFYKTV